MNAGINQKDVAERNNQVSFMKHVYSKAEKVIAWLGIDEDNSSYALRLLKQIEKTWELSENSAECMAKVSDLVTPRYLVRGSQLRNTQIGIPDPVDALRLLLHRPIWFRMWTLQEMVLPKYLWLMCGEEFALLGIDIGPFSKAVRHGLPNSGPQISAAMHDLAGLNWSSLTSITMVRQHVISVSKTP